MVGITAGQNWEYKQDPRHKEILKAATAAFLIRLATKDFSAPADAQDTRNAHKFFFRELAPPLQPYFAGNYRGSTYPGLQNYAVTIRSDRRVGYPPNIVSSCMQKLSQSIGDATRVLDKSLSAISRQNHLLNSLALVAEILNRFFLIHPYANGNGHMGRALIWIILVRYEYFPKHLEVDRSPSYHQALVKYRDGDKSQLINFLLGCLIR